MILDFENAEEMEIVTSRSIIINRLPTNEDKEMMDGLFLWMADGKEKRFFILDPKNEWKELILKDIE